MALNSGFVSKLINMIVHACDNHDFQGFSKKCPFFLLCRVLLGLIISTFFFFFVFHLTRQTNEAVRIFRRPAKELLNSKSELNHPPLARVVVERKEETIELTYGVANNNALLNLRNFF